MKKHTHGFSLFELMIVLVAIGLTAGGVLAGKSLMKSAGLKNMHGEMQSIKIAINQFRTEYSAVPGDMPNATTVWGSSDGNGLTATCFANNKSSGVLTCNGNGNARLPDATGGEELFLIWQHLTNAKLLQGPFTGAPGQSASGAQPHALDCDVGLNCPGSRFAPGTGFGIRWRDTASGDTSEGWFDGTYGHILVFGKEDQDLDTQVSIPILTAEEMSKIDTKFDDGMPAQGNIVARSGDISTHDDCTQKSMTDTGNTTVTDTSAVYALGGASDADDTSGKQACWLILRNVLE